MNIKVSRLQLRMVSMTPTIQTQPFLPSVPGPRAETVLAQALLLPEVEAFAFQLNRQKGEEKKVLKYAYFLSNLENDREERQLDMKMELPERLQATARGRGEGWEWRWGVGKLLREMDCSQGKPRRHFSLKQNKQNSPPHVPSGSSLPGPAFYTGLWLGLSSGFHLHSH